MYIYDKYAESVTKYDNNKKEGRHLTYYVALD